jgi:ABC-2 type transport system permease protein
MAIYKRGYRAYSGPLTPERWRFFVLTRYAWRTMFQSRLLTAFFVLSFFYPLGALLAIYLNANETILSLLHQGSAPLTIGNKFFSVFVSVQGSFAFFIAAFIGPGLVAPDLANGALPLYLGRPFSRADYVLGKMMVLFGLLSFITWLPGLLLFAAQAGVAGHGWIWDNLWLARAIFLGSLIWILILSLLALALSAWVKWKVAAAALMLAIFFLGAGFGQAINLILRTKQGTLTDIGNLMNVVWHDLFRLEGRVVDFPPGEAWIMLVLICCGCLALLNRKLRPHEVVR